MKVKPADMNAGENARSLTFDNEPLILLVPREIVNNSAFIRYLTVIRSGFVLGESVILQNQR